MTLSASTAATGTDLVGAAALSAAKAANGLAPMMATVAAATAVRARRKEYFVGVEVIWICSLLGLKLKRKNCAVFFEGV
jgi:hypothetical protein